MRATSSALIHNAAWRAEETSSLYNRSRAKTALPLIRRETIAPLQSSHPE
jgi:hypothetical protein